MSQHDYVIANASGATVRADLNSLFQALLSQNSGTSAPTTTASGMLWLDTTGGAPYALKIRDAGNNHWLTIASITDPGSDGDAELVAPLVTKGGTGQTTWTQGDILYASGANTLAKLGHGTSGHFLKTQGTGANPVWAAATGNVVKVYSKTFKGIQTINNSGGSGSVVIADSDYVLVGTGASGADGDPLSITCDAPASSSSTYLIWAYMHVDDNQDPAYWARLFYNNSGVGSDTHIPIIGNTSGATYKTGAFLGKGHRSTGGSAYSMSNYAGQTMWSPGSSLAQTISLKSATYNTSSIYVNSMSTTTDGSYIGTATSSLTIMEVAG